MKDAQSYYKKLKENNKNPIRWEFICFILLTSIIIQDCFPTKPAEEGLGVQTIRQGLAGTHIDTISLTPVKGLYEVKAGENTFYSDKTGRYLVFGHLYDMATQQDLSLKQDVASAHPSSQLKSSKQIDWNSLPFIAAIVTGNPKGAPVAVFIDPQCPYCQALQQELLQNQSLKVYEFLLPLQELHPTSLTDAKAIWCASNKAQALIDVMINKKSITPIACNTKRLDAIFQFANVQDIHVTPYLIRSDGARFEGYLPLNELESWANIRKGEKHS